ncbi:uncharacterized protein LOC125236178 isoform X1 [Leguminivora glycinivorella]|uniref:uncharacterized protein LOC125236178 isoform X1 n=1 Tax=Leguminivora glycinivorella TaxID=1035111 RepID=UPI00200F0B09|nr:uncharacterized protein LOC125236178 isoform X1 [Leguminivora glycinivorella]
MRFQCVVLCILLLCFQNVNTKTTKINLAEEDMLLFWRRSNAERCKPFTVFQIDCNHCVCAADGTSSCTRMDCRPRDPKTRRKLRRTKKPVYYTDESDDDDSAH